MSNELTPLLGPEINYNTLNIATIQNDINDKQNEIIKNINNDLRIYKLYTHLIKKLILEDYVEKNNISYDNKYNNIELFNKYISKLDKHTELHGFVLNDDNKLIVNNWNYKENYDYDNIFETKNKKYELIKLYNHEPNFKIKLNQDFNKKKIIYNIIAFVILLIFVSVLFFGLTKDIVITMCIIALIIIVALCCLLLLYITNYIICINNMLNEKKTYLDKKLKREKYYKIIGKNNMELCK
ncbi:hypothetical protein Hokovirus_3_157 [Hokovirus HKV1]|uniref:Uncharacterized protein n=1 Tax=Hokovirus HKV1 TaxID=1977638 RepID=A0A1V0SGV9_9VIRU|nr:hypothetical protein Hokovirus_3_157 [Hokovirus HKV1]